MRLIQRLRRFRYAREVAVVATVIVASLALSYVAATHGPSKTAPAASPRPSSVTAIIMGEPHTPDPADVTVLPDGTYELVAVVCAKMYVGATASRIPALLTSDGDFGISQAVFDGVQEKETIVIVYHLREQPMVPFVDSATRATTTAPKRCS